MARRFRVEFGIPVVFLTAYADPATLQHVTEADPFGYMVKPLDRRTLAATLETALRRHVAEMKLAKMEHWLQPHEQHRRCRHCIDASSTSTHQPVAEQL